MKYDFSEIIYTLFDIFNNKVGYLSISVSILLSVAICKFLNLRVLLIGVIASGVAAILSFGACIVGNTPDYMWGVIFFLPIFCVMFTVYVCNLIVKFLTK